MSVVQTQYASRPDLGEKVVLPRTGPDLWSTLQREWAESDPRRWKYLSILHLYAHCRWTVEMLGLAFGHPKGHISRILRQTLDELAERFEPETDEANCGMAQCEPPDWPSAVA